MTEKVTSQTNAPEKNPAAAKKVEPEMTEDAEIEVITVDKPRGAEAPQKPAPTEPVSDGPEGLASDKGGGSAGIVGWLALVLALGALAGVAYTVLDDWRNGSSGEDRDTALTSLDESLVATRESLRDLEQRLDGLASKDVASVSEIQSLERRLNERLAVLDSLPPRVGSLEGSIASLGGISKGARNAWLLSEAEYYMQIANAQLQLAGNPHLAALALSFADERLLQMADPALTAVRRALSDELRAIEVMEKPDIEGITLTLASLASVVDSLPLRQEVAVENNEREVIDPQASGIDRALASVKRAVGDVVSVRRTNEASAPLTAPDAVYFLRANLALQLQAARLALLQSEERIFEQSLDNASDWLTRYYDIESTSVQSALETVAEIQNARFSVSPPDISVSLRLLRQHLTVSGPDAAPEPESDQAELTEKARDD